jgi:site-specific DNA recombinase
LFVRAKPRPAYQRMLADVKQGHGDTIVSWHLDRLTRRLSDLERLIDLSDQLGVTIATASGEYDLSTSTGKMLSRILATVARQEVDRKGERQIDASRQRAANGVPPGGRRAYAYAMGSGSIVEDEAQHLRGVYRALLEGASLGGIVRTMNQAGARTTAGNPWHRGSLRRALLNPRYAGPA